MSDITGNTYFELIAFPSLDHPLWNNDLAEQVCCKMGQLQRPRFMRPSEKAKVSNI